MGFVQTMSKKLLPVQLVNICTTEDSFIAPSVLFLLLCLIVLSSSMIKTLSCSRQQMRKYMWGILMGPQNIQKGEHVDIVTSKDSSSEAWAMSALDDVGGSNSWHVDGRLFMDQQMIPLIVNLVVHTQESQVITTVTDWPIYDQGKTKYRTVTREFICIIILQLKGNVGE